VGSVSPRLIPDCAGFEPLFVSVKTSVVVAPSLIGLVPKVLATVGVPAVTTRQLLPTPLVRLAVPLMLAAPFVNAAAGHVGFVNDARFVTPVTVIVHEAVSAFICIAESAIESGAPCVTTLDPEHPAPNVTVGVADVNLRLAGSASVNAIPDCAGFEPLLASVKMSVVDPLSAIETAPNAFVSVGCAAFTTRQLAVTAFVTLVAPLMLAAAFVNAAGFAAQLAFVCDARFVTPLTVTVQLAVPALIVTADSAIVSGVPCVTTLEPAHPAPNVTVGVADVNLRFAGRLSVNAIPERAGFVPVFVSVKMSVVLAVSLIAAAANPFVSVGVPAVTTRHWSAEAFVAPAVVTDAVRFVNAAAGHVGFTCEAAFVTPATVTVQLTVPEAIASPVTPESTRVPLLYAALAGPEQPAL
jgi:hypothetical protein